MAHTIMTSSGFEAQGWAPSRWSWSTTASGKSTSILVSILLLLVMMWWHDVVTSTCTPFFSGARFCWCFTNGTSRNLQHCLWAGSWYWSLGSWNCFSFCPPKFESNSVKKNLRDLILVRFFGHPTKLHEFEGAMWEGGCFLRPHRDFVGTLELAAKMDVWRLGSDVAIKVFDRGRIPKRTLCKRINGSTGACFLLYLYLNMCIHMSQYIHMHIDHIDP